MSTMCGCGHDMERHNDDGSGSMTGSYAGNCRMCECEGFVSQVSGTVPGGMLRCSKHKYLHISDWGCPHCYKEAFDNKREKGADRNYTKDPEAEPPSEGDVNDYDLRHLNSQIDSLQRVIGEIYLLSQKDIENGRYEAFNDERRLQRVHVLARKELYGD